MPKLTEEQKQYIKEHPLESPIAMARKFGCYRNTIYSYLHKFHGDSYIKEKRRRIKERQRIVRELYPNHTAAEIEEMTGIPSMCVTNTARSIGVRHSRETYQRILAKTAKGLRTPEASEKRIKAIRKAFAADRLRANSGMKQRTKFKFGHAISPAQNCARGWLMRKYNYFYDKDYGDCFALFYDSNTKRLPEERERYYSEKYKFKFLPADE